MFSENRLLAKTYPLAVVFPPNLERSTVVLNSLLVKFFGLILSSSAPVGGRFEPYEFDDWQFFEAGSSCIWDALQAPNKKRVVWRSLMSLELFGDPIYFSVIL